MRTTQRAAKIKYSPAILGFAKLTWGDLSWGEFIAIYLVVNIINFGGLLALAYGFQLFWAWYMPVFWVAAPVLDYWHSFSTICILAAFLAFFKPKAD